MSKFIMIDPSVNPNRIEQDGKDKTIGIRINDKTIIYVKKGSNKKKIKQRYQQYMNNNQ